MPYKTLIIAEAGVNHNGDPEMARRLIEEAKRAGADYVKFQTFKADRLVDASAAKAEYQKQNTSFAESQLDMLRRLELSCDTFSELASYCRELGIGFLSTPFDTESIHFLHALGVDYMKIPSGEITNLPYLREIARTGIPVIMSTGMCNLGDAEAALDVLLSEGMPREEITILHCNTEYPTPYEDVNLRAMLTLKAAFGTKVGYSDHTKGFEVPLAAVALGAEVIEKHFTLDRSLPGPDHKASLEPDELKAMVRSIRNIERALGTTVKRVSPSERGNIKVARKSIVASRDITEGDILDESNLAARRPGDGLSPMRWDEILGRRAVRNFKSGEKIEI